MNKNDFPNNQYEYIKYQYNNQDEHKDLLYVNLIDIEIKIDQFQSLNLIILIIEIFHKTDITIKDIEKFNDINTLTIDTVDELTMK